MALFKTEDIAEGSTRSGAVVHLLDHFAVHRAGGTGSGSATDGALLLPAQSQRVIAFLALAHLEGRDCSRDTVATRLWTDASSKRAHANLRTALWRIRAAPVELVVERHGQLGLSAGVRIDVERSNSQAARLFSTDPELQASDAVGGALSGVLLPTWDEEWLLTERERLRQRHLHALEALAERLRRLGRYPEAIDAALRAIAIEPLRESAHAVLVDVCLDEGNLAAAHKHVARYNALLWSELRLPPSPGLRGKLMATPGFR